MANIEERKNGWLIVWREDDKKPSQLVKWQLDDRYSRAARESTTRH